MDTLVRDGVGRSEKAERGEAAVVVKPDLRIGSLKLDNPFVVAPMAGVSDMPFRYLCRREGASLAYTEMVSAKGLLRQGKKTHELLRSRAEERPLGVQLFGTDPQELGEAAHFLENEGLADLVDVNMGCPVRKVVKTGAGSALLCEPARVGDIVAGIRRRTKLPVTIKIRAGWDADTVNAPDVARIAQEEGADAVALHPRTRAQGYDGSADWSLVLRTQESVRIPIIGSGDVVTPEQALERSAFHPNGLVMIGRGATGRPWIFRQIAALLRGEKVPEVSGRERYALLKEHFELYVEFYGEYRAVREFKKHLIWYSKGMLQGRQLRPEIGALDSADEVWRMIDRFGERWIQQLPDEPVEMVAEDQEEKDWWENRGWG